MAELGKNHHATIAWDFVMAQVHDEMLRRELHPARVVVLVPYAQLMLEAKNAWLRLVSTQQSAVHFLPRFETTMNWTLSLGGFFPGPDDIRLDLARDTLTAGSLLARTGLSAHQRVLAPRVMEAAWSLARVAAAVPPDERSAWGERISDQLAEGQEAAVFAFEAATARIALAWASSSSYASDVVFGAQPDLLVVLEGFQTEPLAQALKAVLGDRLLSLSLDPRVDAAESAPDQLALHAASDSEDEAQRATACVLAHLNAGRTPVGLVAQDRVLTRRVRALLGERGVPLRDETGWKLSTTRSAAALMSLLRAVVWNASTDVVLDWLKNASAFNAEAVAALENRLRRDAIRDWRSVGSKASTLPQIKVLRDALQSERTLTQWLTDLRSALQDAGQWLGLSRDPAGQAVLEVLRLLPGAEQEFADVSERLSLSEFTSWISQTLEDKSFAPGHPPNAQVVILPMSQLLGRPLAAVVLPGCDEVRFPASPEPPGMWTPAQRVLLGLSSRETLAEATRAAWRYALRFEHLDVLWRLSEGGEHVMPSGFVQELRLQHRGVEGVDCCELRTLAAQACVMPAPSGASLPVLKLSSSSYEDLRRCPYRFFGLRQLKLQDTDELDQEVDKRDFGNWLHAVLHHFHVALNQSPAKENRARVAMINIAAEAATKTMGLSQSEFLPFASAWPRVRAGYLEWLAEHEASGAVFQGGEEWKELPLGPLTLVGKIDRVDAMADGHAWVMDYKTENRGTTLQRVKTALEDTQLAFYAALLPDDQLAAAYVNVGEKDGTKTISQVDIVELRDHLIEGISTDMARIRAGAPMPALGEGKACEYCAARGLCRKDFWEATA
ncbi:PD-(D/E)XK nuclease family protein [Rhodoferax sp. PAMC 29310]|uniref:PD-(D/E)XK nuclease family protein n=1 Tax=Rhodoferax sp. PAMC 29310 TaxID=2822760 RepID=UPI001B31F24B|nr:PD-(D/E)XK nuclease family protein [Rhodoferax sp. PAMC 29310]